MTSLTFYGGVNEIGGNKILLEDEGTRIFLDFGMSFNAANKYFSEFLQPRKCNGIGDFVEFGLLPMDQKIRGIYRKDFLRRCGIKEKEPSIDGVILSHAHLDHSAYISHLSEEIPIYCGSVTKLILKAMQDTGSGSFNDYVAYNENFVLRQKERGEGMTKVKGRTRDRNVKTFSSGDRIKIGEIVIQPMGVDHSIPDSYGFIIQTNKGNIVYTGDLRFHGYKRNRTEEFVKRASQSEPIALICEGTNINKEKGIGEGEVKEKINEIVSHAKGLVIANFPPRDLDRMRTFYEVAKENGRKLIINMKQAYLLKLLENEGNGVISLKDENVRIYIPRKNWGAITDPSFPREIGIQDYKKWEREFIDHPNSLTCKEISKMQSEAVFYCDFFSLKELIDIRPIDGSRYIWSRCEPFTEDMVLERKRVDEWLRHFNLYPMEEAHASGHLYGNELEKMIEMISPATIYPIHTEHPEMFKKIATNEVETIEIGKECKI